MKNRLYNVIKLCVMAVLLGVTGQVYAQSTSVPIVNDLTNIQVEKKWTLNGDPYTPEGGESVTVRPAKPSFASVTVCSASEMLARKSRVSVSAELRQRLPITAGASNSWGLPRFTQRGLMQMGTVAGGAAKRASSSSVP